MKKGISFFLASLIAVSSVSSADAGVTCFSKIREFIFAEKGYDAALDTNGNGRVDVLDMCREKSKVLYPEKWVTAAPSSSPSPSKTPEPSPSKTPEPSPSVKPENYSFLSLGTPELNEEEGVLSIPVTLAKTYIDLSEISFLLLWESESFSLKNLEHGDFCGGWSWTTGPGYSYVEYVIDDNAMAGGTLLTAEFDIVSDLDGEYSFMISDTGAEAVKDGESYILSEEQCPPDSPLYIYEIKAGRPVSVPSAPPSYTPGEIDVPLVPSVDSSEIYSAMTALKEKYPEGMTWTNDNYYDWNGGIYSRGYGCAGFAFMLSDAAFGRLPARMIKDYSGYTIRVGDILRMNNDTHSVIVLNIESDGVIVAEGNYNNSVHWGRKIPAFELTKLTHIITRYPD